MEINGFEAPGITEVLESATTTLQKSKILHWKFIALGVYKFFFNYCVREDFCRNPSFQIIIFDAYQFLRMKYFLLVIEIYSHTSINFNGFTLKVTIWERQQKKSAPECDS